MERKIIEKPSLRWTEGFKSTTIWITVVITVVIGFFTSGRHITFVSVLLTLGIVLVVLLIVPFFMYITRYLIYITNSSKSYTKILQLYGEKESELIERDSIISNFIPQLAEHFEMGILKGKAVMLNESLTELMPKDIKMLEKLAGDNEIELIFDVGSNDGIQENMVFSIVTNYGETLRGVVKVVAVNEDTCRGIVVSKVNIDFWNEVEKDIYTNSSPPADVKARLYRNEDVNSELIELMMERRKGEEQ